MHEVIDKINFVLYNDRSVWIIQFEGEVMHQRILGFLFLFCAALMSSACVGWRTPEEGTVEVKTVYGKIEEVITPESNAPWEDWWGDDYYTVSIRTFTSEVSVSGTSKDNAALELKIAVTGHVRNDHDSIKGYVRKFGLSEEVRHKTRDQIVVGQVNTETKNALVEHDSYQLLANQEAIQKSIFERLKPIFADQMFIELESVQIIGRPDFVDDRIEQAASAVVAANKEREAAEAMKQKAISFQETRQIEAKTFENPAILKLEELKLMLEMERVRADGVKSHQGPLTIVYGDRGALQVQPARKE